MQNRRKMIPNQNNGFFPDLVMRIKLIWRLMGDRRVNFLLKLLPVGALIYLLLPIDLLPDIALPMVGYLDDAAVLWIGMTLFVSLCPDDVVQEHMNALQKVIPGKVRDVSDKEGGEVIDVQPGDSDQGSG